MTQPKNSNKKLPPEFMQIVNWLGGLIDLAHKTKTPDDVNLLLGYINSAPTLTEIILNLAKRYDPTND